MLDSKTVQQTRDLIIYSQKYITGKTIDLGGGSAKYRHLIAEKSRQYYCLDIIVSDNVNICCDATKLSIKSSSLDTIISTQVLEHVSAPWNAISEIKRVLKLGGIAIMSAPFLIPFHADPNDYFRYTREGFRSLFENAGLEIIENGSYGSTFMVAFETVRFLFMNPYKKHSKIGKWIWGYLEIIFKYLDRFLVSNVIYANVFVIARKTRN